MQEETPVTTLVRRFSSFLAILGGVSLVVAACSGGDEGPAATPQIIERTVIVTPTPGPTQTPVVVTATPAPTATAAPTATPRPVVWRIGIPADITSTNIWTILGPSPSPSNLYTQVNKYPSLYTLSEQRFDWVPAWADGFPTPFVREGNFYVTTAKLKRGATWSDGRPVTAHDFVFTVNTALEFGLPGNWRDKVNPDLIQSVQAVDDQTIRFTLKSQPGLSQWQYGLSVSVFVARHYWEPLVNSISKTLSATDRQRALFTLASTNEPTAGEMTLVRWERGSFVEMKANPSYFFRVPV
jgi:ABC-type transport system substrate-binding protein